LTAISLAGEQAAARRSAPAPVSPAVVFLALMRRDLRVARRELPATLVRTLMQPILFIVVFGYLLPRMGFVQGGYTTALLPGILAVSLTLAAIQTVALPMVADFGWTKEIEDRLLAPVSYDLVAIQKIVSGMLFGTLAAIVVLPLARLIMGPISGLSIAHTGLIILVTLLGAATFSAFGLLIGTIISPQQIGLMFSIIISPMIFLGCAYYPWRGLSVAPVVQYGVLINPLVYVAEGLRAVLTPSVPHMPLPAVFGALTFLLLLFSFFAVRAFRRRALG
jgi:ABC-2 type transport system permease protein